MQANRYISEEVEAKIFSDDEDPDVKEANEGEKPGVNRVMQAGRSPSPMK